VRRVDLRTGAIADSKEQLFGPLAVVRGEMFVAQHGRIERLRPTFAEVTTPTFDD
jgi:hypothetical protein